MARKKNNTIFWVIGLGIGGYLVYENFIKKPVDSTATNNLNTSPPASPVMTLPQSTLTTSAGPSGTGSSPVANAAINLTNLVPVAINAQGAPVLSQGQTLAVDNAGAVITNLNGTPMAFGPVWAPNITNQYNKVSGHDDPECDL